MAFKAHVRYQVHGAVVGTLPYTVYRNRHTRHRMSLALTTDFSYLEGPESVEQLTLLMSLQFDRQKRAESFARMKK